MPLIPKHLDEQPEPRKFNLTAITTSGVELVYEFDEDLVKRDDIVHAIRTGNGVIVIGPPDDYLVINLANVAAIEVDHDGD